MHNAIVMVIAVVIIERGCNSVPSSEFLIDKDKGETGRYFVSSGRNYLCHYGRASHMHFPNAFSEQCYTQNKDLLTEHENSSKTYPYFNSSVGTPPGCGPLPVVNDGKWECPNGVSPLSVPVYESCRILCKGDSVQKRTIVKVRCTETLEWDHTLLSAICAVIKNSSGTSIHVQDPGTLKVAIITVLVSVIIVLIVLSIFRKLRRIKCRHLQKLLGNSVSPDNTVSLNPVCNVDVENVQQRTIGNEDTSKCQLSTSNSDAEKEQNTLNDNDIDLCVSRETFQTSDLADTDIFHQTNSNNITVPHTTVLTADSTVKCDCILNNMNQNTEKIELSNEFDVLEISMLTTDSLKNVKENVAIVEGHSWKQGGATRAESCPTIAAMLEGAVDDSIRFVDDLSTLLDPDNPGNWQGLVQAYFSLSFNKIKEIRHKTKDHFKEAVLPLLSSHGFSIFDLTYYFYKLPSRRIDVIECIQRYHPYCRDCGEIYSCVKSSDVE